MYGFSQSQQPQGPTTLARFQLAKFSYTSTSSSHRGPLSWNHVFGNGDLVAIFEETPVYPPGRVLFRVLRNDRETLEEVGITDLVQEYASHINTLQDGSRRPNFAVVVKPPCLAVKYPQGSAWTRRFQIKFSSDRDYYSALSILSEINCPFSEAIVNQGPTSRPASSVSNVGQLGPVSGIQRYPSTLNRLPSTATGMPSPGIGMFPPSGPSPSSMTNPPPGITIRETNTGYLNPISDTILRSSSPSSTILYGTSRNVSGSTTTGRTYKSPLETTSSASNVLPVNAEQDTGSPKQPSTVLHIEELDLPPKRKLPFSNPAAKKSRAIPKAADKPSPKKKASPEKASTVKKNTPKKKPSPPKSKIDTASIPPEPQSKEKHVVLRTKNADNILQNYQKNRLTPPSSTPPTIQDPISAIPKPLPPKETLTKTLIEQHLPLPAHSDLAQYSSCPEEQRIANLQHLFCAHLEDPGFLQLCEDLESIAERYVLGK